MNERGQMEVMGLVIIVILFSMALLFAIKFVVLKPSSDVRETFAETQLASNMLNALLKTTSTCRNADFTELFADCATTQLIDCDYDDTSFTHEYPDGEKMPDSCYELDQSIRSIFSQTLDVWKQKYIFMAYYDAREPLKFTPIASLDCGYSDVGDMKEYQVQTDSGTLKIMLKLCS